MQKNQIKFIAARQNRSVYSSTNEKNTGKTHKCSFTAGVLSDENILNNLAIWKFVRNFVAEKPYEVKHIYDKLREFLSIRHYLVR